MVLPGMRLASLHAQAGVRQLRIYVARKVVLNEKAIELAVQGELGGKSESGRTNYGQFLSCRIQVHQRTGISFRISKA